MSEIQGAAFKTEGTHAPMPISGAAVLKLKTLGYFSRKIKLLDEEMTTNKRLSFKAFGLSALNKVSSIFSV
jgi:hypothetical protein